MYLDDRSAHILESLLKFEFLSVNEMSTSLGISRRTVYYSIELINEWLEDNKISPLVNLRGRGYYIVDKEAVLKALSKAHVDPYLTQDQRHSLITCVLLMSNRKVSVESLVDITNVSRNTIFSDLKIIKEDFFQYDLVLDYDQSKGYLVDGEEIKKRSLYLKQFIQLKDPIFSAKIPNRLKYDFLNRTNILYVHAKLAKIEAKLGLEYVENTLLSLASLISVVLFGRDTIKDDSLKNERLETEKEYIYLKEEFPSMSHNELQYFAIHLISTRTQLVMSRKKSAENYDLAQRMVSRFEKLGVIKFNNRSLLIKQISSHLSTSYYRYKYGIHHGNPLLNQIKESYHHEFILTDKVCDLIREKYKMHVSESEVAYITLYFASFLIRKDYSSSDINFHIVCPSGVSTSMMLKSELEYLHSKIKIKSLMSVANFKESVIPGNEFIISTVNLDTDKEYIRVNPVLTKDDKKRILDMLPTEELDAFQPRILDILNIVTPYVDEDALKKITDKLNRYFVYDYALSKEKDVKIKDVLTEDNVQFIDSVKSWEAAVLLAAQPLIDKQIVEKRYVNAIYDAVDTFGAYMVIEGGFMFAHASFDDGVHKLGLSFLKIAEPIKIKNEYIDKVFVLAPIDQKKHLGIVEEMYGIFTSPELLEDLSNTQDKETVFNLLCAFLSRE
ncbi:MAG: BglG family transcription antiterminator [Erysipelothrix sp.]|nr:BglG family transcription antiterminator [Erysipelothrix sp.]